MCIREIFTLAIFMYHGQTIEIFKQSFLHNGSLVWNSLPGALNVLSCQHISKKNYKMYVLNGNAPISKKIVNLCNN